MGWIGIDRQKCKKDGACAIECPTAIIQLQQDDGYPDMVKGGENLCLRCGHCVAVCPHGALSHQHVPLEECPSINKKLMLNEQQTVQFLRSRRSVRVFQDKPVKKGEDPEAHRDRSVCSHRQQYPIGGMACC